jgi:chemotaxis protein MotB
VSAHDDELHEEHEEHVNHEAWVIPYADLLTLLMAMFIALFAMSTVDLSKFKEISLSFNRALGGSELNTGVFAEEKGDGPLEGQGQGTGLTQMPGGEVGPDHQAKGRSTLASLLDFKANLDVARSQERRSLTRVARTIQRQAEAKGFAGFLSLRVEQRGLVVTVVTDQVLFDSGEATLRPEGVRILGVVGEALATVDNPLLVEGHTDSDPISTARYPSNWELSTSRAGAVIRFPHEPAGRPPPRGPAAASADPRPGASTATAEGKAKNRRVEIVVQSTAADDALDRLDVATGAAGSVDIGDIGAVEHPDADVGRVDTGDTGLPTAAH